MVLVMAMACRRDEPSKLSSVEAPPEHPPLPASRPATDPPPRSPCPHAADQKTAVRIGGASDIPVDVTGGIAWPEGDVIWVLSDNEDRSRMVRKEDFDKLAPKPTRYLKHRCGEGGCGEHGNNIDLVLVDGTSERVIAAGQSEIEAAELVGDDVFWAAFGPYGVSGGLYRAPASGGPTTKVWDGAVTTMLVAATDIYVAGAGGVAWVDAASGKVLVLDRTSNETRAIAVGKERVFWADAGTPDRTSKPSGRILSAPRHGGTLVTHAHEQPWPEAIAADDRRIYWGSRDKGGVWAVAVSGGDITTVVPTDGSCGGVTWLHRTVLGLAFLRGDRLSLRGSGAMWFVPL